MVVVVVCGCSGRGRLKLARLQSMPLSPLRSAQNTHARATSRGCGSLATDLMRSRPGRRAHGGRAFNWPCRAHDRPRMCPRIASPGAYSHCTEVALLQVGGIWQHSTRIHATPRVCPLGPARPAGRWPRQSNAQGGLIPEPRSVALGSGPLVRRSRRDRLAVDAVGGCTSTGHGGARAPANGPDRIRTGRRSCCRLRLPPPARDGHLGPRPIRLKRSLARAFGDVGPDPNR